jgi:hypothetical protein
MAGTRRRKVAPRSRTRITPEAVAAWQAGDYWALWRALGLKLWQMPDWNADPPEELREPNFSPMVAAWRHVCTAREQLLAVAGPPPKPWFYRID